jgi:hypothetical protein
VRLWDPLRAAESKKNGIILAEVNSDVAHFSLGDHFKGEHQLIVYVFTSRSTRLKYCLFCFLVGIAGEKFQYLTECGNISSGDMHTTGKSKVTFISFCLERSLKQHSSYTSRAQLSADVILF